MPRQLAQQQLEECQSKCLPEFDHVNHYWDRQKKIVIAKILPGEFYMTSQHMVIATTLGSCVSACIWDPMIGLGGMNHFMLPLTTQEVHEVNWGQRGMISDANRYGNFAMEHLINMILTHGGTKKNLRAKVFGGGKVMKKMSNIGSKNIAFVLDYLKTEKIPIDSQDLGDFFPRKVLFEPNTGRVFVKRLDNLHNDTIVKRERDYETSIETKHVDGEIELF